MSVFLGAGPTLCVDAPPPPSLPLPHPSSSQCPGGTFTPNMKSTKDYPDEVINFMRNHPAMYNAVYPVHKRPLVVRTNVEYEFTTIAVDQVTAADGNYEVLFLGTGELFFFFLHVVIVIYFPALSALVCEGVVRKKKSHSF